MSMPRVRRPGWWFLAAAVLAIAALVMTRGLSAPAVPTRQVLVAARVIPTGTLLGLPSSSGLLAIARVPDDLALTGLLAGPAEADGRRTIAPIAPGEPVTQAALGGAPGTGPAPLQAGERAVPVPLRAAGASAAAPGAGARVDVLASDGEGPAGRTRVVVSGAEVLALMRSDDGGGDVAGDALMLRLGVDDALAVTQALDFAREVRVVIRPVTGP